MKYGAIARDKRLEAPDRAKVGVAIIALLAKAKEKMPDDEIERYVKMVIEGKPFPQEDLCSLIGRLAFLATDLEPKYRDILFDQMIFLRRQSL